MWFLVKASDNLDKVYIARAESLVIEVLLMFIEGGGRKGGREVSEAGKCFMLICCVGFYLG